MSKTKELKKRYGVGRLQYKIAVLSVGGAVSNTSGSPFMQRVSWNRAKYDCHERDSKQPNRCSETHYIDVMESQAASLK